jgi:hypothetical protein
MDVFRSTASIGLSPRPMAQHVIATVDGPGKYWLRRNRLWVASGQETGLVQRPDLDTISPEDGCPRQAKLTLHFV